MKHFRTERNVHGSAAVIHLFQHVRARILDQQGADAGRIAEHFIERQTHEVRFENRQVQIVRWNEASRVEQNVPPGWRFASHHGKCSDMRVSDPLERIFYTGKIALRGIHEEGVATMFLKTARRRSLAENLKRSVMIEAGDFDASVGDHISHTENRRVIVLHVNEAPRMPSCVAFIRRKTKSLRDQL